MTSETNDTAATGAEQGANVAPQRAASKKGSTRKTGASKGQQRAKGGNTKASARRATAAGKASSKPRSESKGAKILDLIARAKGASLGELMKAVSWKAHSVRGFLSTAAKKHHLNIDSTKNDSGDRIYKVTK